MARVYYCQGRFSRRLSAEEIYDAVITATNTPAAMTVEGIPGTVYYAGQLPDPSEPRSNQLDTYNYTSRFSVPLSAAATGTLIARDNTSNPVLPLTYMNSDTVTPRTFGNTLFFANSLVERLSRVNVWQIRTQSRKSRWLPSGRPPTRRRDGDGARVSRSPITPASSGSATFCAVFRE